LPRWKCTVGVESLVWLGVKLLLCRGNSFSESKFSFRDWKLTYPGKETHSSWGRKSILLKREHIFVGVETHSRFLEGNSFLLEWKFTLVGVETHSCRRGNSFLSERKLILVGGDSVLIRVRVETHSCGCGNSFFWKERFLNSSSCNGNSHFLKWNHHSFRKRDFLYSSENLFGYQNGNSFLLNGKLTRSIVSSHRAAYSESHGVDEKPLKCLSGVSNKIGMKEASSCVHWFSFFSFYRSAHLLIKCSSPENECQASRNTVDSKGTVINDGSCV